MARTITIPSGSLAVMSGIPGSGKSTFLAASHLAPGIVQSPDALRQALAGTTVHYLNHDTPVRRVVEPLEILNVEVWNTLMRVVAARLAQGLTTVVDATLVADHIPDSTGRAAFARLAAEAGVPFTVLLMDTPTEVAMARNRDRSARVGLASMQRFIEKHSADSAFPVKHVRDGDRLEIVAPLQLDTDKIDVIGDVHGMFNDLRDLLETLGYEQDETPWILYRHPQGRRLLFMGDVVDRGPDSLATLDFVRRMVQAGRAWCLMGNHEDKLLRLWDRLAAGELEQWKSYANAQTGMDLAQNPARAGFGSTDELVAFMRTLPAFATYQSEDHCVFFAHADAHSINVQATPREQLIYGSSDFGQFDSDASMARYLAQEDAFSAPSGQGPKPPRKRQIFVRGHIPPISEQPNIISLDERCFSNGAMRALRLDAMLRGEADALVRHATHFDYLPLENRRVQAYRKLKALEKQGLIHSVKEGVNGLRLFKYARSVFYDRRWDEDPMLLRARGHVYDVAGNLVSNPFDKIFNLGEVDASGRPAGQSLPDGLLVLGVEKLNGFLGVVSPHPIRIHGPRLLVHSSGSFDSKFVGYIHDYLPPEVKGPMAAWAAQNQMTLMFEVLHPQDPHIITYGPQDYGLYLIGARPIQQGAALASESELDDIADRLGLRRPAWFETTLGSLKDRIRGERHEGYMVRAANGEHRTLFKMKSPYYLTTKFLSRMKDGNWKHLYANPASFKQRVDEEFYGLVDQIIRDVRLEDVLALDEGGRRDLVGGLVDQALIATDRPPAQDRARMKTAT